MPDEILVVARDDDQDTQAFLEGAKSHFPYLDVSIVNDPGQVSAQNAGLDNAKGTVIIFTDDDTVPDPDWIGRMEAHFVNDSKVGGVGGRDRIYINGRQVKGRASTVGKIRWYGRIIGNHHLGFGSAREADHLRGSNMGFRRTALNGIRFDRQLWGEGAQYRNDLALCLAVRNKGWNLLYDPNILLSHFYAERFEADQRDGADISSIHDAAHNEMLIFLNYLPWLKKVMCIVYAVMIGNRFTPGMISWFRMSLNKETEPWSRFRAAMRGRLEGWKTRRDRTCEA